MFWQNTDVQAIEKRAQGLCQTKTNEVSIQLLGFDRSPKNTEVGIICEIDRSQDHHRERNIDRSEGRPVMPTNITTQCHGVFKPIGRNAPALRQSRDRFTKRARTRQPLEENGVDIAINWIKAAVKWVKAPHGADERLTQFARSLARSG